MIIANIDFKKIDQSRLKKTDKASYGDLVFIDSPRERNGRQIAGFVKQGVSKEEREARVEMPILGDWWIVGQKAEQQPTRETQKPVQKKSQPDPYLDQPEDDIPF